VVFLTPPFGNWPNEARGGPAQGREATWQPELPDDGTAPAQDHDQRPDRIDADGVEADADDHGGGDHAVEGLRLGRLGRQPGRPVQGAVIRPGRPGWAENGLRDRGVAALASASRRAKNVRACDTDANSMSRQHDASEAFSGRMETILPVSAGN